ncbi:MAG: B12-binding domain-containing radical SAM protein [Candidatus Omnitrophica bacterium]|jgi:radical SAM superfamily enzyme YgiQ (UPF0313 family)|nr:B12-binding domain-containing radical SAM protein [Candidatus Omnitrophota bacterium]MCF7891959.1 B12-binding domain-containing radical SAM protein [Candidatus Omnitrophota bacterium]MCF7895479.1 B12-binding domain-containing radical SAM protein [Candidatus Omnitrophota bacterium]MCF7898008.1 B12-binding domain-containing radical SAM protein [Candidatus Omnitrophota bacterium]MCF7909638.1 B12-binding domain-containing radical SAM protein [Candidatus Omnitrophota bacterium]
MRTLLISTYPDFCVGLRYIASFLEKYNHTVFLEKINPLEGKELIKVIKKFKPKVVGFTCYTRKVWDVLNAAALVKHFFPHVKIVLGNIHATVFYRTILREFLFVDYVVLGEGEVPMKQLLEYLAGSRLIDDVCNIAYRDQNGNVNRTKRLEIFPNLDDLSDHPKLSMKKELVVAHYHKISYLFKGNRFKYQDKTDIVTSRGCPYDCDYCSEACMTDHRWRAQSPEKVVDSIERIHKIYNISHFNFQDALFTLDKERVKKICEKINNRGLKVTWSFQTHPKHIDEKLIRIIKQGGCVHFNIGIDCSTGLAMHAHRKIKIDYVYLAKVIRLAKALGLTVRANFITGWWGECFKNVFETARHIKRLRPTHISIYPLQLIPGSKLYNKAIKEKLIDDSYWLDKKNSPFYLGIFLGRQSNIKNNIILKVQKFILSWVYIFYCRNIKGLICLFIYAVECKFNDYFNFVHNYFFIQRRSRKFHDYS